MNLLVEPSSSHPPNYARAGNRTRVVSLEARNHTIRPLTPMSLLKNYFLKFLFFKWSFLWQLAHNTWHFSISFSMFLIEYPQWTIWATWFSFFFLWWKSIVAGWLSPHFEQESLHLYFLNHSLIFLFLFFTEFFSVYLFLEYYSLLYSLLRETSLNGILKSGFQP